MDLLCFCSVLCLLCFVHVCLYVLCGHLLGKGWPLGSRLWCLLWVCHFPIGILGQVWYLIVSIPDLCTLTYFNPFMLNALPHHYQMDVSISNFMVVGCFFYSNFKISFCKQAVENLIKHQILWHMISFFTICWYPTKRQLGLYGLIFQLCLLCFS